MSEENKKQGEPEVKETFTKEEVQALLDANTKELKDHVKKLNEENKNRRLSEKELKTVLAEALGLKPDEKPEADQLKDQLLGLSNSVRELQDKLAKAEQEKIKISKESFVKELANKYNFADASDVLKFINLESEDLEADVKKIAESKPYLLKVKKDVPGGNPPDPKNVPADIDQQIADAISKGNAALAIQLKNKKFGITK